MMKRILVVDDNRLIVTLLKVNLTSLGYEVITADDGVAGLKAALAERPDLIILDVMMPEMDGFEMARQVRNNTIISHVPIIMLTARGTSDSVVTGLDSGADDYMAKPFDMTELVARVKAHLRRSRTERSLNPITNLPGNIAIEERLKQLVIAAAPFAVIYSDIDNFKSFNDAYGFLQGDAVLRALGLIILQAIAEWGRPNDFVGHIGGDDFVICTAPDKVDGICQQIIATFDELMPKFYTPEDRQRGFVAGYTRGGEQVKHPLITISLAVVTNEHRSYDSHSEVSEIIAEIKSLAKQVPHSIYVKDLRSSRASTCEGGEGSERNNEPFIDVALITSDKTLRQVAPISLKRAKVLATIYDNVKMACEQGAKTVIVDYALLTPADRELLGSLSCATTAVIILECPRDTSFLPEGRRVKYLYKPYNFSDWVAHIREMH